VDLQHRHRLTDVARRLHRAQWIEILADHDQRRASRVQRAIAELVEVVFGDLGESVIPQRGGEPVAQAQPTGAEGARAGRWLGRRRRDHRQTGHRVGRHRRRRRQQGQRQHGSAHHGAPARFSDQS